MVRHRLIASCVCLALALPGARAQADRGSASADPEEQDIELAWSAVRHGGGVSFSDEITVMGFVSMTAVVRPTAKRHGVSTAPTNGRIDGSDLPREFALAPVVPNPTHGDASIGWALPIPSRVRLTVNDIQGREVAVLAEGTYDPGRYATTLRGKGGRGIVAGIYFVRLQTPQRTMVRRVVVTP